MSELDSPARLDRQLVILGLVLVVGIFMSMLDSTIVTVALPTIGHDLGAPLSSLQWVVTGYLLALAVVIPASGWLVDQVGAKRLFILSTALFVCGSALCGVAWNLQSLITFRILQGAGGALLMPIAQTMLARAAGPRRMGRAMTVIGVPALLGPVLGPILGGLIVGYTSWRWIFWINVPVGLISLLLSHRVLPAESHTAPRSRFDALGLALLGPALALLTYGLSRAGVSGSFTTLDSWGPVTVGALFCLGYVLHASHKKVAALIPLTLFRDRAFATSTAVSLAIGISIFGVMLLLPLYYQQVRGESALMTGLLLAPQGLGTAMSMPVAGQLADRYGSRWVAVLGMAVVTLTTFALTGAGRTTSYWLLAVVLLVRGLGFGAAMMPAMAGGLASLPPSAAGHASSTLQVASRLGGALGAALLAVILAQSIPTDGRITLAGLSTAFDTAFWWAAVITAAGAALALLLPGRAPKTTPSDRVSDRVGPT